MSENTQKGFTHEKVETNNFLMIVLILLVVAVGGLVEIVPLFFQKSTTEPVPASSPIPRCSWSGATSTSARAATTAIRR
jgi:cytochrome c oxidase cbb3-type subunit 2